MGLAGSGQTLNNRKDYFIANCLRVDDIHPGSTCRANASVHPSSAAWGAVCAPCLLVQQ